MAPGPRVWELVALILEKATQAKREPKRHRKKAFSVFAPQGRGRSEARCWDDFAHSHPTEIGQVEGPEIRSWRE